jgi:hypothetical protein
MNRAGSVRCNLRSHGAKRQEDFMRGGLAAGAGTIKGVRPGRGAPHVSATRARTRPAS